MDIGSYRCPCGEVIEGERVSDPSLPGRIRAHKAAHEMAHEMARWVMQKNTDTYGLQVWQQPDGLYLVTDLEDQPIAHATTIDAARAAVRLLRKEA